MAMSKNHNLMKGFFVALISLFVFAIGAVIYVGMLQNSLISDLKSNLMRTSETIGKVMNESIKEELNTMSSIAAMLENEHTTNNEELLSAVQHTYALNENFLRFGVADMNGDCITTDHERFNIENRPYFQNGKMGGTTFSDTFTDVVSNQPINVFSTPIYQNGEITNVLFASIQTNALADKLLIDVYAGKGYSVIANQDGQIIIESTEQAKKFSNIKDLSFTDGFELSDLKETKDGVTRFEENGETVYLAFHSLDIYNWYVLSIVPSSVVDTRINESLTMASIMWVTMALIFSGILLYLYMNKNHNEKQMKALLYYDKVTEHHSFNQFRNEAQAILESNEKTEYCLLEIDICDFKLFNEFYGYQAGDQLLKQVMLECDELCEKDEVCARIYSDHFAVLLHTQQEDVIKQRIDDLLQRIQAYAADVFGMFKINYKIGIYLIEEADQDIARCQDHCVYAKDLIKDDVDSYYAFFPKSTYEGQLNEKRLENSMYDALKRDEFQVHLQPKITLKDGKVHGAEALVRWHSPLYGVISPARFIPLFEKNGFLETLDMYMLENVCKLLERYRKEYHLQLEISVNISRVYIFRPDFVKKVIRIVERYDIEPKQLEMEITESVIFNRSEDLAIIIRKLKAYGFRVAMDDFGSGYSSLNMLKDIPIDIMKLDQVFFKANEDNLKRSRMIVSGILSLAKTLQINTVAEGIEEQEDVEFLRKAGCDEIQGYYFSKPLTVEDFHSFLMKNIEHEKTA